MNNIRYVIIDAESYILLDDNNGCGYKSEKSAYNKFESKLRYKPYLRWKNIIHNEEIRNWITEHKGFAAAMEREYERISRYSNTPELDFTEKNVEWLLKKYNIDAQYPAKVILQVWKMG